jgi:hypothetical protein
MQPSMMLTRVEALASMLFVLTGRLGFWMSFLASKPKKKKHHEINIFPSSDCQRA